MQILELDTTSYQKLLTKFGESLIESQGFGDGDTYISLAGIERGGTIVAADLCTLFPEKFVITNNWMKPLDKASTFIIDDVCESGKTLEPWIECGFNTACLINKNSRYTGRWGVWVDPGTWVKFPWEDSEDEEALIVRMLEYIGEDPNREGLRETPKRVLKAWKEWFSGYDKNPADIMKVFEDDTSDEIVLLKDIEFTSMCEHHMAPFVGKAHVAYIPNGKLLGASKLARIVDVYAKRLQIQERICQQVVNALEEHLKPRGAACIIEAKHLCISSRGVRKQNSVFVTSALTGVFKEDPKSKQELMDLIRS